MDEQTFRRYVALAEACPGDYSTGYRIGLRAHYYGDKYKLPAAESVLTDEHRNVETAAGFRDGQDGRAPSIQSAEERMATIQLQLPMSKKTAYVRAAQRAGMKLAPWILQQLDRAAEEF